MSLVNLYNEKYANEKEVYDQDEAHTILKMANNHKLSSKDMRNIIKTAGVATAVGTGLVAGGAGFLAGRKKGERTGQKKLEKRVTDSLWEKHLKKGIK